MHINDLRNCLDRRFHLEADRYIWRSTVGKFAVAVAPWRTNAETEWVRVVVSDCLADLEVDQWAQSVRCTDNWRERLQELVGKAMIRAQHRPICLNCTRFGGEQVDMVIRTSARTKSQFFGCTNYHKTDCRYTVSVGLAFDCNRDHVATASESRGPTVSEHLAVDIL